MTHVSTPELLVLHAVRLQGVADDQQVARRFGLDQAVTKELLLDYQAYRLDHLERVRRHRRLVPDGVGPGGERTPPCPELESTAGAETVRETYRAFLPLNERLQIACTQWQLKPTDDDPHAFNDHADPAWDRRVIVELTALADQLGPLTKTLEGALDRFQGYRTRFAAALERVQAGDSGWVDRTNVDSCHKVWFELHEDLIATLVGLVPRRPLTGYPGHVRSRPTLQWVPGPEVLALEPGTTDLAPIADVVADGDVVVLTGAGISTESGIPDYRGETGSLRTHTPMTYGDFVGERIRPAAVLGPQPPRLAHDRPRPPNEGHRAVAALQARGYLNGVITQNVDGLHQAGRRQRRDRAARQPGPGHLPNCGTTSAREALDRRLRAANPDFEGEATRINPDGDVDLPDAIVRTFNGRPCEACGTGVLKPDVVFFGENVPKPRVERCYRLIDDAAALLVLGSSLTVMSGFRFVRHAAKAGKPVLIINQGVTRGDPYAAHRVNLPLGQALTELTQQL